MLALALLTFVMHSVVQGSMLRIVYPPSLSSTSLTYTWAAFGPVPLTLVPARGAVIELDTQACHRVEEKLPSLDRVPHSLTCEDSARPTCVEARAAFGVAVVVHRGGCSFVQKALSLQHLLSADGWPVVAVLVANDAGDDEMIQMADDGHGMLVEVAVLQISWTSRQLLQSYPMTILEIGTPI